MQCIKQTLLFAVRSQAVRILRKIVGAQQLLAQLLQNLVRKGTQTVFV